MDETSGDRDVVEVLTVDHREATALIDQILSTAAPEDRRDLADTLISELVRHSVAEEMYVYPAIKQHLPNGEEAVRHDQEEHKALEKTMKELEGVDPAQPRFEQVVRELQTTLRDHIADEEAGQFPEVRARVPLADLVTMADKVETAKKMTPTRPHPSAPKTEIFHLVGPGVGLVDRLLDKLEGRSTIGMPAQRGAGQPEVDRTAA